VGTASAPWKTIQHACNKVPAGGTVLVETGTYDETVSILRAMTLQSAPSAKPIIDGTGLGVPSSDAGLLLINGVSNVVVQGFEIRNFKTTNSNLVPAGIFIEGTADRVTIRGNLVDHIENDGSNAASINGFGIATLRKERSQTL
jgi:nitrous oxidase accessory protein NosD